MHNQGLEDLFPLFILQPGHYAPSRRVIIWAPLYMVRGLDYALLGFLFPPPLVVRVLASPGWDTHSSAFLGNEILPSCVHL